MTDISKLYSSMAILENTIKDLDKLRDAQIEMLLNESCEQMIRWECEKNDRYTAWIKEIDTKKKEVLIQTNSKQFPECRMTFTEFLDLYKL